MPQGVAHERMPDLCFVSASKLPQLRVLVQQSVLISLIAPFPVHHGVTLRLIHGLENLVSIFCSGQCS